MSFNWFLFDCGLASVTRYIEYVDYSRVELNLLYEEYINNNKKFTASHLYDIFRKHNYKNRSIYNALKGFVHSSFHPRHMSHLPALMYELRYEDIPLLINHPIFDDKGSKVVLNWRLRIAK